MNAILSPLVSDFETEEQATSYVANVHPPAARRLRPILMAWVLSA